MHGMGTLDEAHFSGTGNKIDFMAASHLGYKADPSEKQEEVLLRAWLGKSLFVHPLLGSTKRSLPFELPGGGKKPLPAGARGQSNKFHLIIM